MTAKSSESQYEGQDGAAYERMRDLPPIPRITVQAFCESHEITAAIEEAAHDRRLSRSHLKVQAGGLSAALEFYRSAATPNLIIVETTEKRDRFLGDLEKLAEVCDPSTKVVIIGHVNDVYLYRELIRRGVSEYVVTPLQAYDIIEIIARLYSDPQAKPLGKTIAFIGAKGGVGASVISHNISWLISHEYGANTLIADLDLPFGTANLDFNLDPPQGIADALYANDRLDSNFFDRLITSCAEQLHMLAAPATLERPYDLSENSVESVIDCARGSASWTILDIPHVWTAWARKALISADEIVVVAAPDLANLRNAKNLIDTLTPARANDPAPKLVLNQVGMAKRPEIKPADFARAIDVEPIGIIPFDPQLFGTAANNGQMLAEVQKNSKTIDVLRGITKSLLQRAEMKKPKASPFAFLDKLADLTAGRK
ncbi:MAG: AAA family ATPase [Pseudomonadota bacterium]